MMGMPTCREVARAIATDGFDEAPPGRRLGFRLHLLICRHCRRYARQMRAIERAAREAFEILPEERESLARLRRAVLPRPGH